MDCRFLLLLMLRLVRNSPILIKSEWRLVIACSWAYQHTSSMPQLMRRQRETLLGSHAAACGTFSCRSTWMARQLVRPMHAARNRAAARQLQHGMQQHKMVPEPFAARDPPWQCNWSAPQLKHHWLHLPPADLKASYFVGDAAGRPTDFADSDRWCLSQSLQGHCMRLA